MSEKRFTWKTEKLQHLDEEVLIVVDNANKDWKGHILNIVKLLNELSEENERLRQELDSFHPVMFQDMRRGTVTLYSKGGIDE